MNILPRLSLSFLTVACVMMLNTVCNVIGMTLRIGPPPMIWWEGGWFLFAGACGVFVFRVSK